MFGQNKSIIHFKTALVDSSLTWKFGSYLLHWGCVHTGSVGYHVQGLFTAVLTIQRRAVNGRAVRRRQEDQASGFFSPKRISCLKLSGHNAIKCWTARTSTGKRIAPARLCHRNAWQTGCWKAQRCFFAPTDLTNIF